jgi:hypothetical protein
MNTRPLFYRSAIVVAVLAAAGAAVLALMASRTEADIAGHRERVVLEARQTAPRAVSAPSLAALPAPVQRYFAFAFRGAVPPDVSHVELTMKGRFRRPRSDTFTPTRAEQTIAVHTPAMVFAATTPLLPGVPVLTARAYDAYAGGQMEMKAKLLAAITVVDEPPSPTLNRISLRRWLLESPFYPMALLPGGAVRWEAIDAQRARAVVTLGDVSASLVATFGDDGRLLRFDAEEDGDLRTAYHGSGEHAARDDYEAVDGVMIPKRFVVARAAGGRILPFWEGRVTQFRFVAAGSGSAPTAD